MAMKEPEEEAKIQYGKLTLINSDTTIDIKYVWNPKTYEFDIYTDDLLYGDDIKIIYDNSKQMFGVPNLKSFKKEYKEKQANDNANRA